MRILKGWLFWWLVRDSGLEFMDRYERPIEVQSITVDGERVIVQLRATRLPEKGKANERAH